MLVDEDKCIGGDIIAAGDNSVHDGDSESEDDEFKLRRRIETMVWISKFSIIFGIEQI